METKSHLLLLLVTVAVSIAAPAIKDDHRKGDLAAAVEVALVAKEDHRKPESISPATEHHHCKGGSDGHGEKENFVVVLVPTNPMEGKVDVSALLKKARATTQAMQQQQQKLIEEQKPIEGEQQSQMEQEELKEGQKLIEQLQQEITQPQKLKDDKKLKEEQPLRVRGYFSDFGPELTDVDATEASDVVDLKTATTVKLQTQEEEVTEEPSLAMMAFSEKEAKGEDFPDDVIPCPRGQERNVDGECDEIWSFRQFKEIGVAPF